jgi:hypothetical protein
MENQEKLATLCTQDTGKRQTKQKTTTLYVLDTTLHKETQILPGLAPAAASIVGIQSTAWIMLK